MIALSALFVIIGILPYTPTNSASINYEPIKITVNENFNAMPGQVVLGTPPDNPSFIRQGANFYFHPQLLLTPGYIPSQIEALISSIKHKTDSISKDTPSKIVIEKEKVTEVSKLSTELLATPGKEVLTGDFEITEVSMPSPTEVILMEKLDIQPPLSPISIYEQAKPLNHEVEVIPEAPLLPPLSFNISEEVKIEEPILLEHSMEVFPPIPELSSEPIKIPEIIILEENLEEPPSPPPIIIDEEPKPANQVLFAVPEAPVLPPLSFHLIPPIIVEEVKKEEPVLLEESFEVLPSTSEISTGLTVELNKVPEITMAEENRVELPIPPPIIIDKEINVVTEKLEVIPEAPVSPPLPFDVIPHEVVEVKLEEPTLLEESIEILSPIPEIPTRPILEPIRVPKITIIGENLREPPPIPHIIEETKPMNHELVTIPETPLLPPLSLVPPVLTEEVKVKEPISLEESTEFLPQILETFNRRVPKLIKVPETTIVQENFKSPPPSPIIIDEEPKRVNQQFVVIPEAPVLPPLSFHFVPPIIFEEVKNEEPILLEESMRVFPPIREVFTTLTLESIKTPENTILGENFEMPPPPPPIIIEEQPKHVDQELTVIPEATVLPPLSFEAIPPNDVEEVKLEEPKLFEESMEAFLPIPEIYTEPIPEPIRVPEITIVEENLEESLPRLPILIDEEPNQELEIVSPDVVKQVKIEKPILLEDPMEIFPPIHEISSAEPLLPIIVTETPDFFKLKEISRPNPCTESVISVKENVPHVIIPKHTKALGAFSYLPMMKRKDFVIPKFSENLLLRKINKQPFRFPQLMFSQLLSKLLMTPKSEEKNQFFYSTSSGHNIVEKQIAPRMILKRKSPKHVKIDFRSGFPKGPSKIKYIHL